MHAFAFNARSTSRTDGNERRNQILCLQMNLLQGSMKPKLRMGVRV